MISVECNTRKAWLTESETLTSGSLGQTVDFTFSSDWDGLQKFAVFVAYDKSITKPLVDDEAAIPPEVMALPGINLFVGVYGTNLAGTTIIPTKYCSLGLINPGADPTISDNYENPTASLLAEMLALTKAAQLAASIAAGVTVTESAAFSILDHKDLILTTQEDGEDPVVQNLGAVTAYGAAVAAGDTETYAQFQAKMKAAYDYGTAISTLESSIDALEDRLDAAEAAIAELNGSEGADDEGEEEDPAPVYTKVYLSGYLPPYKQTMLIYDQRITTSSTLTLFPKANATTDEKNNYNAARLNLQNQANGQVLVVAYNPQGAPVYFQICIKNEVAST